MKKNKILTISASVLALFSISMPIKIVANESEPVIEKVKNQTIDNALRTGDVIIIEGKEYTVIENVEGSKYKVLANELANNNEIMSFDTVNSNQHVSSEIATYYETSEIAIYLDNDYFNALSESVKNAIVETSIQQKVASNLGNNSPTWTGEVREAGIHKVFIPSWNELTKVAKGIDKEIVKTFLNGERIWLRDTCAKYVLGVLYGGELYKFYPHGTARVRPAMVLDIDKVNYELKNATIKGSEEKSTDVKYLVTVGYEWSIHSGIDFGKNKGVNQSVSVKSNLVSVTKNVLEESNKLVIKVKGSGDGNGFTITNGGKEKLNYSINDGTKDLGVNETILEVPAGTNEGTKNLEYKLKTADKKAEIAGIYNGVVTYMAEIDDTNTEISCIAAGTKLTIEGKEYTVIEQIEDNQYKLLANYLANDGKEIAYDDTIEKNLTENYGTSTSANYLNTTYYNSLSSSLRSAIVETAVQQKTSLTQFPKNNTLDLTAIRDTGTHKVFIPSWEELSKAFGGTDENTLKNHLIKDLEEQSIWIRDVCSEKMEVAEEDDGTPIYKEFIAYFLLGGYYLDGVPITQNASIQSDYYPIHIRPAMVVDLSKVEYAIK